MTEPKTLAEELHDAQRELSQTCLQQQMHPNSAAITAFVNLTLQTARLSALVELVIAKDEPNKTWTVAERFDSLHLHHVKETISMLRGMIANRPVIQIAGTH